MFKLNDKIIFSLHTYTLKGAPLPYSLTIPKCLDLNFKLLENTGIVEIKEYTEVSGIPNLSNILTIYLGESIVLGELIKTTKNITVNESLDLAMDGIWKERVLIEKNEHGAVYIKKILNSNEITFTSLQEIEKYIRRLGVSLGNFETDCERVKRLLKVTH